MTVKDLLEILQDLPEDWSVCFLDRYGDIVFMSEDNIAMIDDEVVMGWEE